MKILLAKKETAFPQQLDPDCNALKSNFSLLKKVEKSKLHPQVTIIYPAIVKYSATWKEQLHQFLLIQHYFWVNA